MHFIFPCFLLSHLHTCPPPPPLFSPTSRNVGGLQLQVPPPSPPRGILQTCRPTVCCHAGDRCPVQAAAQPCLRALCRLPAIHRVQPGSTLRPGGQSRRQSCTTGGQWSCTTQSREAGAGHPAALSRDQPGAARPGAARAGSMLGYPPLRELPPQPFYSTITSMKTTSHPPSLLIPLLSVPFPKSPTCSSSPSLNPPFSHTAFSLPSSPLPPGQGSKHYSKRLCLLQAVCPSRSCPGSFPQRRAGTVSPAAYHRGVPDGSPGERSEYTGMGRVTWHNQIEGSVILSQCALQGKRLVC